MRYNTNKKTIIWLKLMDWGEAAGCHQMPERSFFIGGWQFPVCARCTGVMIGQILGLMICIRRRVSLRTALICCLCTLTDWLVQRLGIKDSTNKRRLITGILGGIGTMAVYTAAIRRVFSFLKRRNNEGQV